MTATPKAERSSIEVRHCHGLAEFEACLELERTVWGSTDADVVPSSIFVVVEEIGGQVLGAFDHDDGGKIVGFTLAMPGIHGQQRYLHSHMTAVLPGYQNRGVGRRLKLLQREDALAREIHLVEWTFDPLELRNAHFNLERLGAIVRRYLPNVYGITSSPLHGGLPTDRFMAEWWLNTDRVIAKVRKQSRDIAAPGSQQRAADTMLRIDVPRNIADIRARDRDEAARIQGALRAEFQRRFKEGFAVTGIEFSEQSGTYLLEPYAT